jgi:hypothetical protein
MRAVTTLSLVAASISATTAQIVFNQTTNKYDCPSNKPSGAFCVGDSLKTNIILRCNNGTATPGNCNANLAGAPPLGGVAQCWQSSPTAGDASCAKNVSRPVVPHCAIQTWEADSRSASCTSLTAPSVCQTAPRSPPHRPRDTRPVVGATTR